MIDFVTDLGIWTMDTLAQPVVIWTIFALLFWMGIRIKKNFHSVSLYGFQVALILALPLSIISAALLSIPLRSPQISEVYTSFTLSYTQIQVPLHESTSSASFGLDFWLGLIALISLTFFLFFLIRSVLSFVILAVWKRNAIPVANSEFSNICDELFQNSSFKRLPKVAFSSDVRSPLTYGWLQPVILLPLELRNDQDFRMAVQHELIHIQRADFAIHLFVSAVRSLFVWHPLVHLLARSIARNREISCDSKVLAESRLPSNVYAGLLLNYASISNKNRSVSVAMSEPPIKLEERIKAMQDQHNQPENYSKAAKMAFWITPVIIGIIFLISACDFNATSQAVYNQYELDEAPRPLNSAYSALIESEIPPPPPHSEDDDFIVELTITKDGKAINPRILESIDKTFDANFLHLLLGLEWKPGIINGQAVASRITFSKRNAMPVTVAEVTPQPIGGLSAIFNNLTYPETARHAEIEGVVIVQFVVDRQGNVIAPHILRGIGGGCDEAAINAITKTKWKPGSNDGIPVDVMFQVPIRFQLP